MNSPSSLLNAHIHTYFQTKLEITITHKILSFDREMLLYNFVGTHKLFVALNIKVTGFFEMLVPVHQTTHHPTKSGEGMRGEKEREREPGGGGC
jgi:hypothetical protein